MEMKSLNHRTRCSQLVDLVHDVFSVSKYSIQLLVVKKNHWREWKRVVLTNNPYNMTNGP